jgi:oligopeptide/dipeptide ABC transporter ATP-binding protein
MKAIPSLAAGADLIELYEIAGIVPSLLHLPTGCPFNPRCPLVDDICRREKPVLREVADGHRVACWMVDDA